VAVDGDFPSAQQIQVGSVQYQDTQLASVTHTASAPAQMFRPFTERSLPPSHAPKPRAPSRARFGPSPRPTRSGREAPCAAFPPGPFCPASSILRRGPPHLARDGLEGRDLPAPEPTLLCPLPSHARPLSRAAPP